MRIVQYLQNFKNFHLLQEDFGKISVFRTPALKTWPLRLEDSPRWNILSQMGFSEVSKSPYVQKDTFVVEAPDGKRFHLTKAGYVRTPKSGKSATFGQEDIDTMFFYLIERYFSRWLKKIGSKPSLEDQAILAEIKKYQYLQDIQKKSHAKYYEKYFPYDDIKILADYEKKLEQE